MSRMMSWECVSVLIGWDSRMSMMEMVVFGPLRGADGCGTVSDNLFLVL